MMGLGLDYNERFLEDIFRCSAKDISLMAQNLLDLPKLIVVVAPQEYEFKI